MNNKNDITQSFQILESIFWLKKWVMFQERFSVSSLDFWLCAHEPFFFLLCWWSVMVTFVHSLLGKAAEGFDSAGNTFIAIALQNMLSKENVSQDTHRKISAWGEAKGQLSNICCKPCLQWDIAYCKQPWNKVTGTCHWDQNWILRFWKLLFQPLV